MADTPTTPGSTTSAKTKSVPAAPGARGRNQQFAVLLAVAILAGFAGGWAATETRLEQIPRSADVTREVISNESNVIAEIVNRVGPSVVSIDVETVTNSLDFFSGRPIQDRQEGAGTGVIVSSDGYVVTNKHVVPVGTDTVTVTLSDGTRLRDVKVVGRDRGNDIAFLKIQNTEGKTLTPVTLGDSSKMRAGDRVIAIGNSLGQFQNSVTTGIISGTGRNDIVARGSNGAETLSNLIQTDAAINPGNSGGPLVNLAGEVIGLNVAVANGENVGFAIPVNDFNGLTKTVIESGRLEQPYLGVRFIPITPDFAYEYNLTVERGAYIPPTRSGRGSIIPSSPAAKAGLQERDVITKINDTPIDEKNSLPAIVSRLRVGDTARLQVIRDREEITIEVTLEAPPADGSNN